MTHNSKSTVAKALAYASFLRELCHKQQACQNCPFRRYAADRWDCNLVAISPKYWDIKDAELNAPLEVQKKVEEVKIEI